MLNTQFKRRIKKSISFGTALTILSMFVMISDNVALSQDANVTDLTTHTIILRMNKVDEQFDREEAAGTTGIVILDAAGRRGVSMSCYTADNDHKIRIDIKNTNSSSRTCNSECYFIDNNGNSGTHQCRGTVTAGYNGEFCNATDADRTFRITDPGAFDCSN